MRYRALILIAALSLGATACGSGEAAKPTSEQGQSKPKGDGPDLSDKDFVDLTAETEVAVSARDNRFIEPYIEVKAGTPITFTNDGRNQHNVLPTTAGEFKPIDAADLEPGASSTLTFEAPGDYAYYCSLHGTKTKGMVGAVRVLA